jgi:release factor glutamine methyltransferase
MNELELLFTEILGCQRHQLYLNEKIKFSPLQREFLISALRRRALGEPIQYILGKTEFMGLEFKLNQDVFIPRPETEILVEYTLGLIARLEKKILRVLDLCTGSGCIAISLAKYIMDKNIIFYATDLSKKALDIAKVNAKIHQVKINFLNADLFNGMKQDSFDIIVSNPPYIPSDQIDKLSKEISYEPKIALDGGKDGLEFFRRIIKGSSFYLKADGFLVMEIGFGQLISIKNIFKNIRNLRIIDCVKDYSNIERVMVAKKYG